MKTIKLYSLADWEAPQPWDDLIGGDRGKIYLTICGMANLLQDIQIEQNMDEPIDLYEKENILYSLEDGSLQVVLSDYDDELLHDIYIPEDYLSKDLINYHLDIFNQLHPNIPDFDFTGKVPDFWKEKQHRIEHL